MIAKFEPVQPEKQEHDSGLNLRAARGLLDIPACVRRAGRLDKRWLQPFFIERFFERAWTACSGTVCTDDQFALRRISWESSR